MVDECESYAHRVSQLRFVDYGTKEIVSSHFLYIVLAMKCFQTSIYQSQPDSPKIDRWRFETLFLSW